MLVAEHGGQNVEGGGALDAGKPVTTPERGESAGRISCHQLKQSLMCSKRNDSGGLSWPAGDTAPGQIGSYEISASVALVIQFHKARDKDAAEPPFFFGT